MTYHISAMASYAPMTLYDHIKVHCKSKCVDSEHLIQAVHDASERVDVDHKVLLAIIQVESAFKPKAKNGSSVGLKQVHLRYHRNRFTDKKYFDVNQNVLAGAQIYKECLNRAKGVKSKALRCYNGHHLGDPKYVTKVTRAYRQIIKLVDIDKQTQ